MSRFTVQRYTPAKRPDWDAFVGVSRNGTFLFRRGYMDYHADRFTDCSLLAYDDRGRLAGVLPASLHGAEVRSHGGLTYGGWVFGTPGPTGAEVVEIFEAMADFYRSMGIETLIYKPVPSIYHLSPAADDLYALFRLRATLRSRQLSSALVLGQSRMSHSAADNVRRARRAALAFGPSERWAEFWTMLTRRLAERHGVKPVHTLAEIESLRAACPDRIRLYCATSPQGEMLAGTVIYDCGRVLHTQYIASSEAGRSCGALAGLFDWLIDYETPRDSTRYLDFGTSCERDARVLNQGLLAQKSSYGARGVVYDEYLLFLTGEP